ncbi:hypothetical protein PHMEG_0002926 [Phytophthora megakarya]|uniref:Uncharacterized protein n=1 Tax=Phytophthora megakarya TaxID=4795 RepID=A0A225WXD1_9STRA|nr:hypothetical protein PHMEG_0002926 [Phytophthora megakarya]
MVRLPGSSGDSGFHRKSQEEVQEQKSPTFEFGMALSVKNAVRMIQPFYSEGATMEKAQSFWTAFERGTEKIDDTVRLNAFRVLIGLVDVLTNRGFSDFTDSSLQPIYLLQIIGRFKSAKCSKGMSVEIWGYVISNLCEVAQVTNPQMQYQYFLAGLRNKEWKTILQSTMANTILYAVMTLLHKNMHLPVEDDTEFEGDLPKRRLLKIA